MVDGNNVIGASADGWWRDRPAAVRRLLRRLQCLGEPATLVLDVAQPDLSEGDHGGVAVRYATRRGRDAADDLIREIVVAHPGANVAVVSHKATIRLLISSLLGFDARGYRDRLYQSPACLNILDFRDTVRVLLMLFNDTSHYTDQPTRARHQLSKWWDESRPYGPTR